MKSFHLIYLPVVDTHYPSSWSVALKIRQLLSYISSSQVQDSGKIQLMVRSLWGAMAYLLGWLGASGGPGYYAVGQHQASKLCYCR